MSITVCLIIFSLFLFYKYVDADVKRHNSQCDIKDIEDEISRLKTEIEELKVENEYLQQQIVDDLNKNDLIAD